MLPERYYGWQLHLLTNAQGCPVSFELLPAAWDELTHVQDLLALLPEGATVVADKGYISQLDELLAYLDGGIRLVPKYRKNMRGNSPEDAKLIGLYTLKGRKRTLSKHQTLKII